MDDGQVAVLPAAHAQEEADRVRLLLLPELIQVAEGTHLAARKESPKTCLTIESLWGFRKSSKTFQSRQENVDLGPTGAFILQRLHIWDPRPGRRRTFLRHLGTGG